MLSTLISQITPSATLAISALAKELKKQGQDVISFGAGEPDFDTPNHIKEAAKKALDEGFTKYTDASGMPELKETVIEKFKRENNISYNKENIIISNGGKHSLYNIFQAILNENDEVIIPSPYWVSYTEMIKLARAKAVIIDTTKNNFQITAEMIAEKITPKTKIILLNSPSNPTGSIISQKETEKIAELALKNNVYLLSDEVYEHFIYDEQKTCSPAAISPEIKNITITVNAVSKTYSMTGWRIGYLAAPAEITKVISAFQSHTTSNPCSIAQKAAIAALSGDQTCVKKMRDEFKLRRDYLVAEINKLPNYSLLKPAGAFYAFIDVSKNFKNEIKNSFDFCKILLKKVRLAVVPGGAFGKEGNNYIRFSYATDLESIKKGVKRLTQI